MAIFPNCEVDLSAQVNDKIRISASKSFVSKDNVAITKVEIKPSASDSFIDVSGASPLLAKNWYLDWEYSTAGTKTIEVKVTAGTTQTITKDITVVTEATDKLFSSDADLVQFEPDILKWVPEGRNTFKFQHRRAQSIILEYLDNIGLRDSSDNRLTLSHIADTQEFKEWSTYITLRLIFDSISNQQGDRFELKAREYESKEKSASGRAILRLDLNADSTISASEKLIFRARNLIRI